MSTPTFFDVIRESGGGALYRAVKQASGGELGAPWVRITAEQYADEVAAHEATPRRQSTDVVRRRLTSAEKQALHAARVANWQIDDFVSLADSAGVIDESDPNFPAAVAALDCLGIITAQRWDDLLAP